MAKIETVAVACKENERAGYKIINKSDLKKGQKALSKTELNKLIGAAEADDEKE